MRPTTELMVHQRVGAPLRRIHGRLATAPAWTAVEMARSLRRPRALAVLDAAVRSTTCTTPELWSAAEEQKGRRGIVNVRGGLLPHVDPRAESAMESEARLVFIDGGIPPSTLQHEIVDRCGDLWRVDFAWPEAMVAAEYDSMEWHANPTAGSATASRRRDCRILVGRWCASSSTMCAGIRSSWSGGWPGALTAFESRVE